MQKRALLTDYVGKCQCGRHIQSTRNKGGYVEFYEHKGKVYCLKCGRGK